jgi:chromosome segregation ATPase
MTKSRSRFSREHLVHLIKGLEIERDAATQQSKEAALLLVVANGQIISTRATLAATQKRHLLLMDNVRMQQDILSKLQVENTAVIADNESMREANERLSTSLANAKDEIRALQSKISFFESYQTSFAEKELDLQKRLEGLEDALASLKAQHESELLAMQKEYESKMRSLEISQSSKCKEYDEKLLEAERERKDMQNDLELAQTHTNELEDRWQETQQKCSQTVLELEIARGQLGYMTNVNHSQKSEKENTLGETLLEVSKQRRTIATLQTCVADLEKLLAEKEITIETLRMGYEATQRHSEVYSESQEASMGIMYLQHSEEKQVLERVLRDRNESYELLTATMNETMGRNEDLVTKLAKLEERIAQLQSDYDESLKVGLQMLPHQFFV